MTHILLHHTMVIYILIGMLIRTQSTDERSVSVVPNPEPNRDAAQQNTQITPPSDTGSGIMNPALIAALKELNDDPSSLQPNADGQMVDLSQFEMDPAKLDEMIEIFDWIESQLPPDDPQRIQRILNNIETLLNADSDSVDIAASQDFEGGAYSSASLLSELELLPDFLYQVDNGADFMKMKGVAILLRCYNEYRDKENDDVLAHVMNVIGVASQNNPNAIQYTHQSNAVGFIIDELRRVCAIEGHSALINKLLFALSSITRQSDVGLDHFQQSEGPSVLFDCAVSLSDAKERVDGDKNVDRAFGKLVTMVSDIVVLNRNRLEGYASMFLRSERWCEFMIERGLLARTDSVLQFLHIALERKYCALPRLRTSLKAKLSAIVAVKKMVQDKDEEDDVDAEFYEEGVLTQATNMLKHLQQNYDSETETTKETLHKEL